jgi:putative colanic acid biosynthesis acetyltransferase WcaF
MSEAEDFRPTNATFANRDLSRFTAKGYDKGRGKIWQVAWFAVMNLAFSAWWFPPRLRPRLLRLFGAEIGAGVLIRHRVRILWPWKLTIGNSCWIGEDVWLLNLEPILIGNNVCVSQGAFLCTGSHDHHSACMEYDNAPITLEDGVWVAAQAMLLRGVTIGPRSVVSARELVATDVAADVTVRRIRSQ